MNHVIWRDTTAHPITGDNAEQQIRDLAAAPPGTWSLLLGVTDQLVIPGDRSTEIDYADAIWQLRLDIDFPADRAAVTWLPTGEHGIEPGTPETADELEVWEEAPPEAAVRIPAERVRVTAAAAARSAVEYVTTGTKPTLLTWAPAPV